MAPLLVNCAAIELISPAIHIGKWLNSLVRKSHCNSALVDKEN